MIVIEKTLLLVITLFFISTIDAHAYINQFKSDTEKTVKYTVEESEKETKEEKNQIDEVTSDFFTYSIFSNLTTTYCSKQKINFFKLSIPPYRPPISL